MQMHDLIYISGRGGKTTIASQLAKQYNVAIISLDDIIEKELGGNFKIYQPNNNHAKEKKLLVDTVRKFILKNNGRCIVEGTIKDNSMIKDIFAGYIFTFYYVVLVDRQSYIKNVEKRFISEPERHGNLGFLRRMDANNEILHEFNKNGIDSEIVKVFFEKAVDSVFERINTLYIQYCADFEVVQITDF